MLGALSTNTIVGLVIDGVLVIALVLFFFLGLKKGFIKMCKGFVASVAVLVIAGFAAAPLAKVVIKNTEWDDSLETKITAPMAETLPHSYAKLYYYDLDGDPETADVLVYDDGEGEQAYENIFDGTIYGKLGLQKIMQSLVEQTITEETPTVFLIDALGQSIVYVIFLVITFIIVAVVSRVILAVAFHLLKKVVSNLYIMHFLDKFLGGVFGLASGTVAILCVLAVIQLISGMDFMSSVNTALDHTYIAKFAMEYNVIHMLITNNLNFASLVG